MFVEESTWIRGVLDEIGLPGGSEALDVGCSTSEYRSQTQPHVRENVWEPLLARGVAVRGLDIKEAAGVDHVCDISAAGAGAAREVGRQFELVLCNNTLVHVSHIGRALSALAALVAEGGHLVVTTPRAFRPTVDPIDNGYRPRPEELAHDVGAAGAGLVARRADLVRIDGRRYYRRSLVPPTRVGSRRLPVPGMVEQLRYAIRPLRWKESCVLFSACGAQ